MKQDNRMRTGRSLIINNGLCQGICNYNCRLCGIGKDHYSGPREFQPLAVTEKLVQEIQIAAEHGILIRGLHHSGMGEPTLHPEFGARLELSEKMRQDWNAPVPAPDLVVVTNGSTLLNTDIMAALTATRASVSLSLPTLEPQNYGKIMMDDAINGKSLIDRVIPGIRKVMELVSMGRLGNLVFHISPPHRDIIRKDFHHTIEFLAREAQEAGLEQINLIMFVTSFNRTGLVRNRKVIDFYRDFFKQYHKQFVHGVRVHMITSLKRFYPHVSDVFDLLKHFTFPCLQNGHLLIAADGSSICPNDQEASNPLGNIMHDSIESLMQKKERYLPNHICARCDSAPHQMSGIWSAKLYSLIAKAKLMAARDTH
jgi:sulfatase maturation enzyme AslB (radical SAM superfamily)